MVAIVGINVDVNNIVGRMCSDKDKWNAVNPTP